MLISNEANTVRLVLEFLPSIPTPYGRDEQRTGETWNSLAEQADRCCVSEGRSVSDDQAQDATTVTEISVAGANCPLCFNETIDDLRAQPGVQSVTASFTGHCLRVAHTGGDPGRLLATVRDHLHADAMFGAEHAMTSVEPRIAEHLCARHARDGGERGERGSQTPRRA